MDIPELAHLCDSYEFVRELTDTAPEIIMSIVSADSTVTHSIHIYELLTEMWRTCARSNPDFRNRFYAQFAHSRGTQRRLSQSLLMVLQLAEASNMITSTQDRDCTVGFCGWTSFTVVMPEEFNNLVREMHPGNPRKSIVDNYFNTMLRNVSMYPLHKCWRGAWAGQDMFIFLKRDISKRRR